MKEESRGPKPAPIGANGADSQREEDEVSLIDLLLVVARYKRLIGGTVLVFFVLGFLVAVLSPDEYTSSAKVVREIQADAGALGSIGALSALRGFGLSLGAGATGLTPEAYPDITKGREVRLAVVRDTFFFPDMGGSMPFVTYVRQNRGILGRILSLPGRLLAEIRGPSEVAPIRTFEDTIIYLTEDEERAIKNVSKYVSTSVDLESGLMTISATTSDPYLSAALTASFVEHLVD
ncbi:MAG: Wzz/FepE/Etk N-terminal domain-containing protein, partial [Rhodothermales bacterium]|nr:Wzz/FepE/Etk N-terminal domain-containing protein [Rhodothermales bacterium]